MSNRLKRHIHLLHVLHNAKPQLRKAILEKIDNDAVRCLCECCHNLLNGFVDLKTEQRKQLIPHRSTLRKLGSKGLSLKNKKKLLVQKGGFLSALIGPLLAVAATLLSQWTQ